MIALGLDIGGSSVKGAILDGGRCLATAQSDRYDRPDQAALRVALRNVVTTLGARTPEVIGLCAPGAMNTQGTAVERSVNVPGIVGVLLRDLIADVIGASLPKFTLISDAHATAADLWATEGLAGRLVAIALGTGVGACVLDDGVPLRVTGASSGHFGQIDVSLSGSADEPIGPDGGRGGLEAYIGLRALESRLGAEALARGIPPTDPAVDALVRALRIAHAMYRPDHIRLAGGVGLLLVPLIPEIRRRISDGLTSLARQNWTLASGRDAFHAARGAARAALGDTP